MFQQEKQAQRQKEFQQAYANAYASGDRGALRQLATQYPDQIESVRKGMGFIDEDQRNSIGTLAAGARLASSSPEAMQSWLQNNAKELTRVGVDPNNVAQMYVNRPGFPGECFICELRLPDHRFRWKHNKLFLLLPEEYGPAFPAIVDCYTSPPT
ncbi:hypothetical protein ECP03018673_2667 [Escherichia coli P0301867.3]|nr:hypothetical protein ECP03018672_2673 [Escherichia coli P0301867.2]ENC95531.1 hypothetical protein ECP03018678_2563 [Escherichia coli P0301867.8]ENG96366.1 hypothetical protein ECP03018673_2667 [Escherichia coli P0301867.3]ENH08395.1 hypothetical protein ECP03018677_2670 [Escherichia coli P0301867.7]